MKLFQYDKKVWDDGEIDHTWQFGIFKNRALLWVNYQPVTTQSWSSGGNHVILSLFSDSLFGVEFYPSDRSSLSVYCLSAYFKGWTN